MRSFASPAARVLRSVGSVGRPVCGAHARLQIMFSQITANDHPLSNLYHGRIGLSSVSRSGDSNQPDAAPCLGDGFRPSEWSGDGAGSTDSAWESD